MAEILMATGIPRRPKRTADGATVTLSYPGKRNVSDILRETGAADFVPVTHIRSAQNALYFGENLTVLAGLADNAAVRGKVRLVYIDPPYATQTVFHSRKLEHAYDDVFEMSEYMEFMRERLVFIHHLLADDGSIYVHLDAKMVFHIKLILDEIFGAGNFRNCITRKKSNPKNFTRKQFGNVSDYVLFYTKSEKYVWNKQAEPWTEERAKEYQYIEPETGRRFMKVPIHAPGVRNGDTGREWRGMMPPPGKHWQFTPDVLDQLDAKNGIAWSKNGNPRRKVYLDESDGISVQDIWLDYRDANNQMSQITGYPTEKNIDLLSRIVKASSDPDDLVLDCFAGSGTTLVAADMLGRRWIGVDNSPEAIRTMLQRFEHGSKPMGDFVGKQSFKRKTGTPSLFDEEYTSVLDSKAQHQVDDFVLYGPPGFTVEASFKDAAE